MATPRWRRVVEEALTERLGYKAAAIVLAVVIWLVANAEERRAQLAAARTAEARAERSSADSVRTDVPQ